MGCHLWLCAAWCVDGVSCRRNQSWDTGASQDVSLRLAGASHTAAWKLPSPSRCLDIQRQHCGLRPGWVLCEGCWACPSLTLMGRPWGLH